MSHRKWSQVRLFVIMLTLAGLFFARQDVSAQDGVAQAGTTLYLPIVTSTAQPLTQLTGSATAPATAAIPRLPFTFRPQDYSPTHPDLSDLMVSYNTLFVAFTLDATVGEANTILRDLGAVIVGGIPGKAGQIEGLLLLRLPTTTHQAMSAVLAGLRANPKVKIAVQDSLLEGMEPLANIAENGRRLPNANGGNPGGWTWQVAPAGDNWGMELMRVPQMWNLNPAIAKEGGSTITGVHDSGFSIAHPDLSYAANLNPFAWDDHGTHVAGTIGATFNNGLGVDGVNPFARLVVNRYGLDLGWSIFAFFDARPDLQVVNISLGNNWYQRTPPLNPNTNLPAQILVSSQAQVLQLMQNLYLANGHPLPFILVAAGNDSGAALGNVEARWSSPFTYAALVLGVENIMVVEAIQQSAGAPGGGNRAAFSNIKHAGAQDAAVSAAGVAIMSTFFSTLYSSISGTSMATPHVSGLVSYLLSLDPTLTHADLRKLLLDNDVPVGAASNRVDAFASALDIDRLRGNSAILQKLVDIDDGSVDGNQRVLCQGCADFLAEDVDGDGGSGDGRVDMADFRRWRDWLLQVEASADLNLDGSATHPKKDVNANNGVEAAAQENVYPRGDFNGDGIVDRTSTRFVPGAVNSLATDLAVLQILFSDPHYGADDLPALIDSADLDVDAQGCLNLPDVVEVHTKLVESGSDIVKEERIYTVEEPRQIFTAAVTPTGYEVKVTARNSSGKVIYVAQDDFLLPLGSDTFYEPECGNITLDPELLEVTLNVEESKVETVRLISDKLEADYEIVTTVEHVTPDPTQGNVAKDTQAEIKLTLTCPATAGNYPQTLDLLFRDGSDAILTEGVPDAIEVKLKCLKGGVNVIPNPVELTTEVEQSIPGEFKLQNLGTTLNYTATAAGFVEITDNGAGTLDDEGEATVSLNATCPEAGGHYSATVGLSFARTDGKPLGEDMPSGVDVKLTCIDNRAIIFHRQLHSGGVRSDYPPISRGEVYLSEDAAGTATRTISDIVGDDVNVSTIPAPVLGFGDVGISASLTGVFTYTEGSEEKARTVSATAAYAATSTYTNSVGTFNGTINTSYSESDRLPFPFGPADRAAGQTNVTFDLLKSATVEASWSCGSQFQPRPNFSTGIRLTRISSGSVTIFAENDEDCHFSGRLEPGRYAFLAIAGILYGVDLPVGTHAANQSAAYSMTITIDE